MHGGAESMGQTGTKHFLVRNPARAKDDRLVASHRPEGLVEMMERDSPRVQATAKRVPGKITMPAQKRPSTTDCLMKRQVFEAMQRVVMDEGAHGPVLRDHFTRKTHDTAKL